MAKSKRKVISGPMDAKHVDGVNVSGSNTSSLDSYFTNTTLEPDELPSHTFVATGTTEMPRRSDTIAGTILRPSVSLRRSISKLRRASISHSHLPDVHRKHEGEHPSDMPVTRSDSARATRPLKMQSSMSRLRQKVGLDRELYESHIPKSMSPEPETAPKPIQKDYPPLTPKRSSARLTATSSIYPPAPESSLARTSSILQRHPSTVQRQTSIIRPHPSASQRPPSPLQRQPSNAHNPKQPSVRPKRADSGTAIDFDKVPVHQRPLGFKEILAVQSLSERMALYKKTREYWASADHGLLEWTERAGMARMVAARV